MTDLKNIRLNEKFIDMLEKLSNIMIKSGEKFRASAYQKASETILQCDFDILSPNDLKNKPGIGKTIMNKLNEFVETGTLEIFERDKNNPINIIGNVYGIGPQKSKELVENGITSIEELRANQHLLNNIQKIGLKYYEDILKSIPRNEIEEYKSIFENAFKKVSTNKSYFEIVGSYRRGAKSSSDIDLIITSDKQNVFINFIDELIKNNIIIEILSRGKSKCLVIGRLSSKHVARRIDFLYANKEEYPFSILYFTGSKFFNTVMRNHALQLGLTMNEHGLYKFENKKKGAKIKDNFNDEKDIFDYLNLVYKSPEERIDGRSVVIKE